MGSREHKEKFMFFDKEHKENNYIFITRKENGFIFVFDSESINMFWIGDIHRRRKMMNMNLCRVQIWFRVYFGHLRSLKMKRK